MSNVTFEQSISLYGLSAGQDQSLENPLGIGGEELHTWVIHLGNPPGSVAEAPWP